MERQNGMSVLAVRASAMLQPTIINVSVIQGKPTKGGKCSLINGVLGNRSRDL